MISEILKDGRATAGLSCGFVGPIENEGDERARELPIFS